MKSSGGNTSGHLYATTDFAWSRVFPIKGKGDVHYTLNKLFHHYGVPMRLISGDMKEN